ncbi:MAG: hypothetical protein HYW38_00780 [Candidatus Colwellbacteria bacterium]|nr:hypothetical protein [Candidatus Colwellbacteria bacterium]
MKKLRVAVLTGGPFAEHESSLLSGEAVRRALAEANHEVVPVLIKRDGDWSISPSELKEIADLVFVAMHGKYGEDGMVQDTLKEAGMRYTGTNALSSALAINKFLTGRFFRALGFRTPRFAALERADSGYFQLDFDFPVMVKPVNRGLSLGVGLDREPGELPLTPVEIVPKRAAFHDYYTKYSPDISEIIFPASLSGRERDLVEAAGLLAHQAIGAAGVSKTDMILDTSGRLYLLEINTIPSFVEAGALSRAASGYGLSLAEVCERIIKAALAA